MHVRAHDLAQRALLDDLAGTDLSLSNGACRLDIDDDRGLQIDQSAWKIRSLLTP
jgi:hypothetical protein